MAGISFSYTQLFDTFFSKSDWRFLIFSYGFMNKADAPPPNSIPEPNKVQQFQFQFQTSEILLF